MDAAQAWYWTPEWQEGEKRADTQATTGQGRIFADAAALLNSLVD